MEHSKEPQSVAQVMAQVLSLPTGIIPKPSYESAADVPLTQEEIDLAISRMKWEKMERIGKEDAQRHRAQLRENLTRPWTWVEMLHFVRHQATERLKINLQVDTRNEHTVQALCRYFVSDPDFESMKSGWKLNKGLMLMGGVGTGKTTLAKLFSRNQRQCYQVISSRTAAELYEQDGETAIEHFSTPFQDVGNDPRWFYQKDIAACFDDLGTEKTPVIRYGNRTNVMADILLNRYDSAQPTHITTNLLPEEIEGMYGSRVRSRINEMFNLLIVGGDDRRSS